MPVVMPSRSVLLKNMFTEEEYVSNKNVSNMRDQCLTSYSSFAYSKTEPEWAKELEEDVKEEAEKSGAVVHIHVEQESLVC